MTNPNAENRSLRKLKGLENSVKQMLNQEYKFPGGEKIQEMFIKDLLVEFNRHLKDSWKLDAGQVVWWVTPPLVAGVLTIVKTQRTRMNIQAGIRPSRTPEWFRLFCPLPARKILS